MRAVAVLALLAAAAVAVSATAQLSDTHVEFTAQSFEFERSDALARGDWAQSSTAPDAAMLLDVSFALRPRNMDQIRAEAQAVSDPLSPRYGQHLNGAQIAAIVSPPQAELDAVTSWLSSHAADGVTYRITTTRHMIKAKASVSAWERVLHTTLRAYVSAANPNRKPLVRKTGSHWLPRAVAAVVTHVTHIADTPMTRKGKRQAVAPARKATANGPTMTPGTFSNCSVAMNAPVTPFFPVAVSQPSPIQGLAWGGYVVCRNTQQPAQNSLSECVPAITGWALQFTLTDPFGQNTNLAPAATVTTPPMACENDGTALLCSWQTNLIVPQSMGVAVTMTVSYNDSTSQSLVGNPGSVQPCTVMPRFPMSTPQFLSQYYGIPMGSRIQQASQAVYASGDNFDPNDLLLAGQNLGLEMGVVTRVVDDNNPNPPGGEASLDLQIMLSVTRNATTWFWNLPNDPSFSVVTGDILDDLEGTPLILSVSYGGNEGPDSVSPGESLCAANLAMIATTSHTIITASGDNGVMGNGCGLNGNCTQCCLPQNIGPEWPATSPYVVAVGATQIGNSGFTNLLTSALGIYTPVTSEIMCGWQTAGVITSGGGYSQMYEALDYTLPFIAKYLQQPNSQSAAWPPTQGGKQMRAWPDVAMSGANFPVYVGGVMNVEYGTSASCPLFASIVTLLNDARLRNGLPPMGHMGPFLYHLATNFPDAFTDITLGNNEFANPANGGPCSNPVSCGGGLHAAPGWDATTGLGSVRFERFIQYALAVGNNYNIYAPYVNPRGADGADASNSTFILAIVAIVVGLIGWIVAAVALRSAHAARQSAALRPVLNSGPATGTSDNRNVPFLRVDN